MASGRFRARQQAGVREIICSCFVPYLVKSGQPPEFGVLPASQQQGTRQSCSFNIFPAWRPSAPDAAGNHQSPLERAD